MAATIRVITHTNPVHALLYLIVSLLAISAVFFSLGAYFAAALEIIVYAGAIMVLFVFVVMMLNLGNVQQQERDWMKPTVWIGHGLLSLALLVVLIVAIRSVSDQVSAARWSTRRRWASACSGLTYWRLSWLQCCCWRVWLSPSISAASTSGEVLSNAPASGEMARRKSEEQA